MRYGTNNQISNSDLAYKILSTAFEALEEKDFESSVKLIRSVLDYGNKHKFLKEDEKLIILEALGIALLGMGCYEEGIVHIKAVYYKAVETRGEDDLLFLLSLHSLGEAYLAIGKINDALDCFKREYGIRLTLDPADEDTIKAGHSYATSLRLSNNGIKAISIHIDLLSKIDSLQLDPDLLLDELIEFGRCYISIGKYNKAAECFDLAYRYSCIEYSEDSTISQEILMYKRNALQRGKD